MLTDDEREAIRMAGRLSTFIADRVCGHGPTREQDIAELEATIHHIQRLVMAQSAARDYPGELRLMGEVIGQAAHSKPPAVELLEEALFLRMNGEYAPGGNENWHDWDLKTETFLRSLLPPEEEEAAP